MATKTYTFNVSSDHLGRHECSQPHGLTPDGDPLYCSDEATSLIVTKKSPGSDLYEWTCDEHLAAAITAIFECDGYADIAVLAL